MSRRTNARKKAYKEKLTAEVPDEDREWFIRENAVAIVNQKEQQIKGLKKRLAFLEIAYAQMKRQVS